MNQLTLELAESSRLKRVELAISKVDSSVQTEEESVVQAEEESSVDQQELVRTESGNCVVCYARPPEVSFGCSSPLHAFCEPCMVRLIARKAPCPLCHEVVPRANRYGLFVKQQTAVLKTTRPELSGRQRRRLISSMWRRVR